MKQIPVYGIKDFSEGEASSYFYANTLSRHLKSHKFINAPHKHNTFISILFTSGSGVHYIDFETYSVNAGMVFLLNPGQVHSWTLSDDVKGYVFFHTREFYDRIFIDRKIEDFPFFFLQQNYPAIELDVTLKKIVNLFKAIYEEFIADSRYKMLKLGSMVDQVYLELAELYKADEIESNESGSNYLRVKKLQKFIDENFRLKKSPAQYADMMHLSIRHLNRICQETLGKTTGDLIFDRIILEAKRALIHSNVSIAQVAELLGYEDSSYFIRLFRKKTGQSPKEFQMKMAKPFN